MKLLGERVLDPRRRLQALNGHTMTWLQAGPRGCWGMPHQPSQQQLHPAQWDHQVEFLQGHTQTGWLLKQDTTLMNHG